jgi:hypothetical protein
MNAYFCKKISRVQAREEYFFFVAEKLPILLKLYS